MNNQGYRFARLLWLYGEIAAKGPISFKQIDDDWQRSSLNSDDEVFHHRTFENHRKDVEDLFNVIIECDRATNLYSLAPGSVPDFGRSTMEMLNIALLFNRAQTNPQMTRFIRPEEALEDSSLLFMATDAITEGRELRLRYRHNYDPNREVAYTVKPIAVKQFRRRWYIIAELADGSTYSFPLDRILLMKKGEKTTPSAFDVDELFADSFGIIREKEIQPENITIKVEREQANYFLSQPLHKSQNVLSETTDSVTFTLRLCPTYDFIMEVLSHGPKVEVLAPQSLRNQIKRKITQLSKIYSK
ncbi:MAG: WYL domain-containing protein [Muribaculaceae bacterium]|nr:WYL domain-containing protein [Muribaculaceae bacterium]